jgi:hypothetical protein
MRNGDRERLARVGRRPLGRHSLGGGGAGQLNASKRSPFSVAAEVIGETPMTATETIALPVFNSRLLGRRGISMHGLRRKCGQADRDVFGALRAGRAVLHPFAGLGHDRLSGVYIQRPVVVSDSQRSFEHDGELVELGRLGSTQPAGLRIWAMLRRASPEFTRPTNSSMSFGLLPAAVMRTGLMISFGIKSLVMTRVV